MPGTRSLGDATDGTKMDLWKLQVPIFVALQASSSKGSVQEMRVPLLNTSDFNMKIVRFQPSSTPPQKWDAKKQEDSAAERPEDPQKLTSILRSFRCNVMPISQILAEGHSERSGVTSCCAEVLTV